MFRAHSDIFPSYVIPKNYKNYSISSILVIDKILIFKYKLICKFSNIFHKNNSYQFTNNIANNLLFFINYNLFNISLIGNIFHNVSNTKLSSIKPNSRHKLYSLFFKNMSLTVISRSVVFYYFYKKRSHTLFLKTEGRVYCNYIFNVLIKDLSDIENDRNSLLTSNNFIINVNSRVFYNSSLLHNSKLPIFKKIQSASITDIPTNNIFLSLLNLNNTVNFFDFKLHYITKPGFFNFIGNTSSFVNSIFFYIKQNRLGLFFQKMWIDRGYFFPLELSLYKFFFLYYSNFFYNFFETNTFFDYSNLYKKYDNPTSPFFKNWGLNKKLNFSNFFKKNNSGTSFIKSDMSFKNNSLVDSKQILLDTNFIDNAFGYFYNWCCDIPDFLEDYNDDNLINDDAEFSFYDIMPRGLKYWMLPKLSEIRNSFVSDFSDFIVDYMDDISDYLVHRSHYLLSNDIINLYNNKSVTSLFKLLNIQDSFFSNTLINSGNLVNLENFDWISVPNVLIDDYSNFIKVIEPVNPEVNSASPIDSTNLISPTYSTSSTDSPNLENTSNIVNSVNSTSSVNLPNITDSVNSINITNLVSSVDSAHLTDNDDVDDSFIFSNFTLFSSPHTISYFNYYSFNFFNFYLDFFSFFYNLNAVGNSIINFNKINFLYEDTELLSLDYFNFFGSNYFNIQGGDDDNCIDNDENTENSENSEDEYEEVDINDLSIFYKQRYLNLNTLNEVTNLDNFDLNTSYDNFSKNQISLDNSNLLFTDVCDMHSILSESLDDIWDDFYNMYKVPTTAVYLNFSYNYHVSNMLFVYNFNSTFSNLTNFYSVANFPIFNFKKNNNKAQINYSFVNFSFKKHQYLKKFFKHSTFYKNVITRIATSQYFLKKTNDDISAYFNSSSDDFIYLKFFGAIKNQLNKVTGVFGNLDKRVYSKSYQFSEKMKSLFFLKKNKLNKSSFTYKNINLNHLVRPNFFFFKNKVKKSFTHIYERSMNKFSSHSRYAANNREDIKDDLDFYLNSSKFIRESKKIDYLPKFNKSNKLQSLFLKNKFFF